MDSSENDSESEYSVEKEGTESSSEEENSSDDDVPKLADDEYKEMPFEDLLKLQKKLGSRVYNEAIFGKTKERTQRTTAKPAKKPKPSAESDSDDDSGPEEVTSKRKVPALGMGKKAKNASISRPRDPRFDPRQGYFSGRQFRNNYGFINDLRNKELRKLKNKLELATDPEEVSTLKFLVQRTENQIREYAKQKALDSDKLREKQQVRESVKEGKRPFFERKSTKQARALVEQYDKLKDDGSLAKHIDKRRKKISAKDRKKLDFST
ncbi:ribosomal RNA processing protein 36 homolog [Anopheles maculipalpis]|uniref:ribosomal RNA processing protein 36 homolog n=1 Tax=Anopheles maculipalpis TaxID=1496333 RepID=UPI002159107B|nr:ribosomal RNA processing protein 36 homolog [Anopheles maculipalpis]